MKKLILTLLAALAVGATAQAVVMKDLKIYINPGHGGYTGDDRPIQLYPFEHNDTLGYWESKSNLYKGLHMYHILDSLGTKAYLSRIKNTQADDRSLSGISAEANKLGVDLFFSIHSNAGEDVNYPLMLYREQTEGTPRYPENVTLSKLLWKNLHSNQLPVWTRNTEYVCGDLTFYKNMWSGGLGVLRQLYVVGLLSEGGMHEHRPEAHRLMNDDYLWLEAWHFVRTIMEFYNTEDRFVTGNVAGIVYDDHNTREFVMPWRNHAYGRDVLAPLNGSYVELRDAQGNVVQRRTTDNMYNGVFVFRNVKPGSYRLVASHDGYYTEEKDVTVTANEVTYQDMPLNLQRPGNLVLTDFSPVMKDGKAISCSSPLVFTFNYDIDTEAFEKAVTIEPAVEGRWVYSNSYHTATYIPTISLSRTTDYTVTLDKSARSADTHNAGNTLAQTEVRKFTTLGRDVITITGQYPAEGGRVHYAKPTIEFRFDNRINTTSMSSNFKVTDANGNAIALNPRQCKYNQLSNGMGSAAMVLSKDLIPGQVYTVTLDAGLRDNDNIPLGTTHSFTFTAEDATAAATANDVVFDDGETGCNFTGNLEASSGVAGQPGAAQTTTRLNGLKATSFTYAFTNSYDGMAQWNYNGEVVHFNTGDVLSAYVNGDNNGHELYAVLTSGTSRKYIKLCDMNFRGWQRVSVALSELEADWCPFNFEGFRLMQTESPVTQRGSFVIDDISRCPVDDAGVRDILADEGVTVTAAAGTITVDGIHDNAPWCIYATDGRKVDTRFGSATVNVAPGIYMVAVHGHTVKVSVF